MHCDSPRNCCDCIGAPCRSFRLRPTASSWRLRSGSDICYWGSWGSPSWGGPAPDSRLFVQLSKPRHQRQFLRLLQRVLFTNHWGLQVRWLAIREKSPERERLCWGTKRSGRGKRLSHCLEYISSWLGSPGATCSRASSRRDWDQWWQRRDARRGRWTSDYMNSTVTFRSRMKLAGVAIHVHEVKLGSARFWNPGDSTSE